MKNYLQLAPKYISAHKKRSRLAMISVIISVALVAGIFSILDSLVLFEKQHVVDSIGDFHIMIKDASSDEISRIQSRFDVVNSGTVKEFQNGTIQGAQCNIVAIDTNFIENMNLKLMEGSYPNASNEIILEKEYMEEANLKIGDTVSVTPYQSAEGNYVISGGFQNNLLSYKSNLPIILLSVKGASSLTPEKSYFYIQLKDGINIRKAGDNIKSSLNIPQERIILNEALLALMLQSLDSRAIRIYAVGVILFVIVLITAVVMIYNTFNISIMERVRQYGLLRCIGISRQQIKRLVRREGLLIAVKSIPLGLAFGILMSIGCLVILRILNVYDSIALFHLSPIGLLSGVILGFLTILLALLSPARKASRISPISALGGYNESKISKKKKQGILSKLLPIDVAIGIENATGRKKTLFLMSCSIALSIILFLIFSSLATPDVMGVKPILPHTPDVRLLDENGIDQDLYEKLTKIDGVKRVYGRMNTYVTASFNADLLTSNYMDKAKLKKPDTTQDNFIKNPEKSLCLSYDKTQFEWAENYLINGKMDEDYFIKNNGILAVNKVYYNKLITNTNMLKLGDKVRIQTDQGEKEFTVLAVANAIPYTPNDNILATFVVTEKQFKEMFQQSKYKVIDIQLTKENKDAAVAKINELSYDGLEIIDRRESNSNNNNIYLTICIFIYGFVGVIAMISILNIVNTMHTSIAAKIKRIGVMRAVGMSGPQLSRMVVAEVTTFCFTGCAIGCFLGVFLQKTLSEYMLIRWHFPFIQIIWILVVCLLASVLSVIGPLKQLRQKGISEIINAM